MARRRTSASPAVNPAATTASLHELFLEQGDSERLGEHVFEVGVRVGDRFLAVAAAQVGVHGVALDRPGTNQRDFDRQVVEAAGLQTGQGGLLGAGFDLNDADGVGFAEHVVHRRVVGRDVVQLQVPAVMGLDELEGVAQRGEHAEAEQVELGEPDRDAVVLVPFAAPTGCPSGPTRPGTPR
jgi:hypothetical protein